jgi:hypothetical protein
MSIRSYYFDELESAVHKLFQTKKEDLHTAYKTFGSRYFYSISHEANSFTRFQQAILPLQEELEQEPEYILLSTAYSLLLNGETPKYKFFHKMVELKCQFNYENLCKFINYYLYLNLRIFTEKIINQILLIADKYEVQEYVIDIEFKNMARRLLTMYKTDKIKLLSYKVNSNIEKILISKYNEFDAANIMNILILQRDIDQIYTQMPWLFDAIQLRDYFWKNYITEEN